MTLSQPLPIRFCGSCGLARESDEQNFCGRCGASFAVDAVAAADAGPDPTRLRNILMVGVLTAVTFGLYFPVWLGRSWIDLRREIKDPSMRSPLAHALLSLIPFVGLRRVEKHFGVLAALRSKDGPPFPRLGTKFAVFVSLGSAALSVASNYSTTTLIGGTTATTRGLDALTVAIAGLAGASLMGVVAMGGQHLLNEHLRRRARPAPSRPVRLAEWASLAAGLLLVSANFAPSGGAIASSSSPARTVSVAPFVDEAPAGPPISKRLSTTDVAELGRQSTIFIQQGSASGSGVVVGQDLVLTALHVVEGTAPVTVSYGGRRVGEASTVRTEAASDLAMLRVTGLSASGARAATWGNSQQLRLGDTLVVIGYPLSAGLTVSSGIVSGLKTLGGVHLVQTDAAVNPGNSGGPVLSPAGELVGIADFTFRGAQGLSFAVASRTARTFVDGTLFTPVPTIAVATPSAAPTSRYPIPSKGPLLYALTLDGKRGDLTVLSSSSDASGIHFVPGAIELTSQPGAGLGVVLSSGALDTYIGEYEIAVAAGTKYGYAIIQVRRARTASGGQSFPALALRLSMTDGMLEGAYFAAGDQAAVFVMPRVPIDGLQSGRTIVLAVIAEATRYTVFLDQRQVAQFQESRITGATVPDIEYVVTGSSAAGGSVRVLGARIYRIP